MKTLPLLSFWGAILLLGVAPLAAQNTVDVIGGPQPTNTAGCAVNPNCIPAVWSTTSNAGSDISAAMTANFVFVPPCGATPSRLSATNNRRNFLARTPGPSRPPPFLPIPPHRQAPPVIALPLLPQ